MKRITKNYLMMAALALSLFTACSDDNDDVVLPPIGGYNTSDEVAAANLVAKWSFEGNLTESKSGLTGASTNVAYTTGKKGQGWQGSATQARYAVYTAPTAFAAALSSYTIAFWMNTDSMKLPGTVATQGRGAQGILSVVDPTHFWGGINLFIENRSAAELDTIKLKMFTRNVRTGVVWQDQSPIIRIPNARNTWVHIALTYEATSGRFSAYVNGVLAARVTDAPFAPAGVGYPGTYIQYANDPGTTGGPIHGALQLPATTQIVIGSHQFSTTPSLTTAATAQAWATTFAGMLDEIRIYKTALVAADVNALYQLELAGR